MTSNICKYCQEENREQKEIQAKDMPDSKFQLSNGGPGHAIIKINHDPSLVIQMNFYDKLRNGQVEMMIAPAINYCPWCGRKL